MAKDLHITISTKKRRALNEVEFAAAIDALAKTNIEIKDPYNSLKDYSFDVPGCPIYVCRRPIASFLEDVKIIAAENAQYEREQTELRRANQHFTDEHVRLSERIAALAGENAALNARLSNASEACVTWEQRHTNVKAKLAAKDELLNAAGRDLEKLRAGFSASERELARVREERDAISAERDLLAAARENQRNTIIGFQQRMKSFDAEATRLRAEIGEERAARRQEAASAAGLSELYRLRGDALMSAYQALSSRNEELAVATSALEAARKELASSDRTLAEHTHNHGEDAAQYAVNAYDAAGKAARVVLTFCADGSIVLDTGDGPVTINGNVAMEGNMKATGVLSS